MRFLLALPWIAVFGGLLATGIVAYVNGVTLHRLSYRTLLPAYLFTVGAAVIAIVLPLCVAAIHH